MKFVILLTLFSSNLLMACGSGHVTETVCMARSEWGGISQWNEEALSERKVEIIKKFLDNNIVITSVASAKNFRNANGESGKDEYEFIRLTSCNKDIYVSVLNPQNSDNYVVSIQFRKGKDQYAADILKQVSAIR